MYVGVVARLPQRLKSTFFEKNSLLPQANTMNIKIALFFRMEQPQRDQQNEENISKTLILAFEVILQPPKIHCSLWDEGRELAFFEYLS